MKKLFIVLMSFSVFVVSGLMPMPISTANAVSTEHIITSDFISFAKQGKLKGFPLSLGMKKADVVKIWGKPSSETMHYTEYDPDATNKAFKCTKCLMRTMLHYNYQDTMIGLSIPIKPIAIQSLAKQLGKPKSIRSSESGYIIHSYQFGIYNVDFSYEEGEKFFTELYYSISNEALNSKYPIKSFIDGKQILYSDHPAILIQGKLYIPASDIITGLGGELSWETNGVNGFFINNKVVELINDGYVVKVNGKLVTLKTKPVRVKQRLLLPFEDYAKLLGIKYTWNPKTNILNLKSK